MYQVVAAGEFAKSQTCTMNDFVEMCTRQIQGLAYLDLGFVIDTADYEMATITATKLQDYQIRMTVTVRDRDDTRLAVRANARYNDQLIEDPGAYQDFFTVLDKANMRYVSQL